MAYMSQERKQAIAAVVKPLLKQYGLKGSLSVSNHIKLVLTIKEGKLDFIKNFNDVYSDGGLREAPARDSINVNHYYYRDHFNGKCREFLTKVIDAMMEGNHDRSDIQTDYFDIGWYIDVNIGSWNKPYVLEK